MTLIYPLLYDPLPPEFEALFTQFDYYIGIYGLTPPSLFGSISFLLMQPEELSYFSDELAIESLINGNFFQLVCFLTKSGFIFDVPLYFMPLKLSIF